MTRPIGDVSLALMRAASQNPGTVRQLAERAHVRYDLARVTAHRLVGRGDLDVMQPGRPSVLGVSQPTVLAAQRNTDELLRVMHGSFWESSPSEPDCREEPVDR